MAQLGDAVTTYIGLQQQGIAEENPLFQQLLASAPWLANLIKLAGISAVLLLALVRLPLRRARSAVLLAAGLSLIGPLANLHTLL